ncbi:hypothetical protein [Campylobacter concisus]|nr:hypothetical protein [Campylobacter concisus]
MATSNFITPQPIDTKNSASQNNQADRYLMPLSSKFVSQIYWLYFILLLNLFSCTKLVLRQKISRQSFIFQPKASTQPDLKYDL